MVEKKVVLRKNLKISSLNNFYVKIVSDISAVVDFEINAQEI